MRRRLLSLSMLIPIIGIVIVIFFTHEVVTEMEKDERHYKVRMGQKVVINGDTLIIIDYSTFKETFTLSNGVRIDTTVASKLILK